jgi:spore coat polysaccharide biosynthesis protein SpsF (cytidylyltransferase family)
VDYMDHNQELFNIHCVDNDVDLSNEHWVVDTMDDLKFINVLYSKMRCKNAGWRDIYQAWVNIKEA